MKPHQKQLLTHPVFLISLFLLLLNDLSLKYEFPNWITGKLSDFSGLLVFSIFFLAILPLSKKRILASIAVFFFWWKSSLSTGFIECWNGIFSLQLNRVVDYTDLLALLVLPVAHHIASHDRRSVNMAEEKNRPILLGLISLVTLFSFCYTSMPRHLMSRPPETDLVNFSEYFRTKKSTEALLQKLTDRNISYYLDSIEVFPAGLPGDEFVIKTTNKEDSSVSWLPVTDSTVYVRRTAYPFYVIPNYNLDGENLRDLTFSFYPNKKKLDIYLRSFRSKNYKDYTGDKRKLRKKYVKHFTELFK